MITNDDLKIPDDEWNKLLGAGFTGVHLASITDETVPNMRSLFRRYKVRPSMWQGLEPTRLQAEKWKQPRYTVGDLAHLLMIRQLHNLFPTLKHVDLALAAIEDALAKHGDEAVRYGCFIFTRDARVPHKFFEPGAQMEKVQPYLKLISEHGIAALLFFPVSVQMEMSGRLACWYRHVDFAERTRRRLATITDEQFKKELEEIGVDKALGVEKLNK